MVFNPLAYVFFTVYGPWGRPDMAYYSFTKAILEDRPIEIFNHGKMSRDFTYIDDIVSGIIASLEIGPGNHVLNLGNGSPEALGLLLSSIEEALEKKAIIEYKDMQLGDVQHTFADISESVKVLGYEPKTCLKEGIFKFVSWYKEHSLATV